MAIKVTGAAMIPASDKGQYIDVQEQYLSPTGLRRAKHTMKVNEDDFYNEHYVQYSDDNGKTWGPEEDVYGNDFSAAPDGSWEILKHDGYTDIYNPVHRHYTGMRMERIFRGGRKEAYGHYWSRGRIGLCDHCYLSVRGENETEARFFLIRYEKGPEFDPEDPLNEEYFLTNTAYFSKPYIAENGDVLFVLGVPVSKCCAILGIDPNAIFPSRPDFFSGIIIGRGVWNGASYDVAFSNPVVLSDLQSSRGMDEPMVAELKSGRVIVVNRGSNVRSENWDTRIEPGTPGFKWYCFSDDGGKTFTQSMPWRFDDGEVVYSSATIHYFIRSQKNGKLYWIGNVTGHKIDGNYPRWPLQIAEVDETYGTLKKDTFTVIDTKRECDSDLLQLSNFSLLEDRETGDIELWLAKIGQFGKNWLRAETWKYRIELGE